MIIEEAIAALLEADSGVSAIVDDRIFPQVIRQDEEGVIRLPAITYTNVSGFREHSLLGPAGYARPRMQIDCWAYFYLEAKQIAEAVRLALDGFRGDVSIGSDSLRIESSTLVNVQDFDADEGKIRRVSLDFSIHHQEAT